MIDRRQILDQLARWQSELATIKADMDDPEQACMSYGLSGDFCFVFKTHLTREASQAEETIATLQKELYIYDLLVGTWVINVEGQSGNFTGQFNITSLNTNGAFLGTMILSDTSQAYTISGSYNDSEQVIYFMRPLPEDFAQQYIATVNSGTQPPTMDGEMTQILPHDAGDRIPPPSRWSAQKQS